MAGIRKHHVTTVRNRYAWREVKGEDGAVAKVANNRQANRVVTTLSILLSFAIDRPDGKPWGVNTYQKAVGAAIRAAGLSGVVWHGVRATGLTWAAEGGASERALMALAGHLTASMSQRYTRGAERNRLARDAVAAIALPGTGTDGQSNVPSTGAENVPSTGSAT